MFERLTVTVAQMRELDRAAIRDYQIPALLLMENAGAGAARVIRASLGPSLDGGVLVVAGTGNNGGDGYVVARHLHNAGHEVAIAAAAAPASPEARCNHDIARALGVEILPLDEPARWPRAGVVVDALLGIGISGALRPPMAAAIEAILLLGEAGARVVAMDVPSGLDADTGRPATPTVRATITTTFGACKAGLVAELARPHVGELSVIDISLPRALLAPLAGGAR
jgi:NAD(P)H-hydrate epimerase